MHERWPKGSRGPRGSRAWLVDSRGRQYRLSSVVSFHVYFQATEGKLWSRLYRDGVPLRLPSIVSRAEFIAEVGNREGAYQLQPIDGQEKPIGDPPSMVFLPLREPVVARPVAVVAPEVVEPPVEPPVEAMVALASQPTVE